MKVNKYKSLVKDVSIFSVGNIVSKAILFFMLPLYTRHLTTEQFGISEMILTVAQILLPFVSMAINESVLRFGLGSKNLQNILLVGLLIWIIGSCLTCLISPFISNIFKVGNWNLYLNFYVIETVLFTIIASYIKASEKNLLYVLLSVSQTALLAAFNVLFLVVCKKGIEGYLYSIIFSQLIVIIASFFCVGVFNEIKKSKLSKDLIKNMCMYSAPLALNNFSWWLIQSSDKIMIRIMLGASTLGIYAVASKVPALINVFVSIFQQAWGISSVKEINTDNDKRFYANVFESVYFFVCFICLMLIFVIKPFMAMYVKGSGYENAWKLVPMLLVSSVYCTVITYYGSMYCALKKSINHMGTTLAVSFINVLLNYVLIKFIGVAGAPIGTLLSYFILAYLKMMGVNKYITIPINYKRYYLNSFILILDAFLVSYTKYGFWSALILIIIFMLYNYKMLIITFKKIRNIVLPF